MLKRTVEEEEEEGETKERARSAEHGSRSETLGDVPGHGKRFL